MNEQYSPTGFRVLPTVVKHLLIINVLMFVAAFTFERFNIDLANIFGLHFFKASDFRVYQIITYMFMHANFGHLFFNMFALWMFGNTLENIWGSKRFLLFYMVCGIGAGICQEVVQYIQYATSLAQYETVNMSGHLISMDSYLNMMTTVGALKDLPLFPISHQGEVVCHRLCRTRVDYGHWRCRQHCAFCPSWRYVVWPHLDFVLDEAWC